MDGTSRTTSGDPGAIGLQVHGHPGAADACRSLVGPQRGKERRASIG